MIKRNKDNNENKDYVETFFRTFAGEYVEVLTDMIIAQPEFNEDHSQSIMIEMPMIIQSNFVDFDGVMVYFSHDKLKITQAIPFTSIKNIRIVEEPREESMVESLLSRGSKPDTDTGYN